MRYFLLGALVVYSALAVWAAWDVHATWDVPWSARGTFATVLLCAAALPLAGAWAGAELARAIRRPALFARRGGRAVKLVLGGVGAALSTIPMIAAMTWGEATASDATITAAGGAAFGFVSVIPLPRRRKGGCRGCGYDLSSMPAPSQPGFGRCPECGGPVMG